MPDANFRTSFLGLMLRRSPVLIAAMLLGALGAVFLADTGESDGPQYESRALLIASRWELRIEGLSRMIETVLQTDDFRQQLQVTSPTAFADPGLFDDAVTLVPVQDTVAVWVEATADSAELAQIRANATADTLVVELNRLGTDIGLFTVQDRAPLPTTPVAPELNTGMLVSLGLFAGLALGSGVAVAWPDRERQAAEASKMLEPVQDLGAAGEGQQRAVFSKSMEDQEAVPNIHLRPDDQLLPPPRHRRS